ncbi:dna2 [Candida theae]|uniref:DNA replication ATP-dependent helicase/nuclease DNA2 n=1 Tax=Candida theae TaxID=1198502 RepID=A0AAD5BH52_9ASCO|nr:dna2 [Candida theae]KAI5962760.1 dna2 [Candida theae]
MTSNTNYAEPQKPRNSIMKSNTADTESIKPLKRPKKQSYFFKPVNKLTGDAESHAQVIKPIDTNTFRSQVQPVREVNSQSHAIEHSPKRKVKKHLEVQIATDNSDDSFDGVRWRDSPDSKSSHLDEVKVNTSRHGVQYSSSPLKNIKHIEKESGGGTTEVLSKYGADFYNVSSISPKLTKTRSDLSSKTSKFKAESIGRSSLQRTKSTGLESAGKSSCSGLVQGALSSWISKLNSDEHEKPKAINIKSSPTGKTYDDTLQSNDPFSEDEEILKMLSQQEVKQEFSKDKQSSPDSSPSKSKQGLKCEDLISSPRADLSEDPFSDETDPEILNILNGVDTKTSVFTKSFKEGMQKYENLWLEKSGANEKEEEFTDIAYGRSILRRLKILNFIEQVYGANGKKQIILEVTNADKQTSRLILRGEYCELDFGVNDIIHVINTDKGNPNLIDDTHNLLVLNPDILISATKIAQQINCPRETVLVSRYKFPGTTSIPIIVGEMVHYIFQECMVAENWSFDFMREVFDDLKEQYFLTLCSIDKDMEDIDQEVEKHLPYLQQWFESYYKKVPSKRSKIDDCSERDQIAFAVDDILDIEEEIRSPVFGLKGMVDATIIASLRNKSVDGKFLLPMEIKTGREYISHSAQASLYALLFKDRYDMDIDSFVLVYTKEGVTKRFQIRVSDLRSLINLRNRVSQHLRSGTTLPEILRRSSCERCNVVSGCMAINYLSEDGTKENSGIDEDEYDSITTHLQNPKYKEYFNTWDTLISREESVMTKSLKHVWTLPTYLREEQGTCLSNLKIIDSNDNSSSVFYIASAHGDKSQERQFMYTFVKDEDDASFNMLSSKLTSGDRVLISDEDGHFAIATGTIKSISPSKITLSTRRRIVTYDMKMSNFSEKNNQVMESLIHGSEISRAKGNKRFIIDKDEMFYGMGLARYNVLRIFLPDSRAELRDLLIDLKPPKFSTDYEKYPFDSKFNHCQTMALNKVFAAEDYALILGMPGTGKSTIIVEMVRRIVEEGKTVLLTSYTNSAVDNILLKIVEKMGDDEDFKFLRIGYPLRVHKSLHKYIPDYKEPIKSRAQYRNTYEMPNIVATTCLGISDSCFNLRQEFDYCIVDEASQITVPINLGPISLAKKFILVGDHYQLPPLVLHPSPEVRYGLSRSLFRILAEAHPDAVSELTEQYRMCEDIMQVSNILVYENKLRCGSETVANQYMDIQHPEAVTSLISPETPKESQWMDLVFDKRRKVLFFDHDTVPAYETVFGEAVRNSREATLIQQIVKAFVTAGVDESQVGVMSFYRSQLELLKRNLSSRTELEILTADQYQGRDKQCVIISLVRSNKEKNAGDLLKEWRRLNVAVTRAKSKLIIFGSRSTLSTNVTTKTFIDFLESKGWYYSLPCDADKIYDLPPSASNSPIKRRSQRACVGKSNAILKNVIDDITK